MMYNLIFSQTILTSKLLRLTEPSPSSLLFSPQLSHTRTTYTHKMSRYPPSLHPLFPALVFLFLFLFTFPFLSFIFFFFFPFLSFLYHTLGFFCVSSFDLATPTSSIHIHS